MLLVDYSSSSILVWKILNLNRWSMRIKTHRSVWYLPQGGNHVFLKAEAAMFMMFPCGLVIPLPVHCHTKLNAYILVRGSENWDVLITLIVAFS